MTADATYLRSQLAKARRDAEYQRKRAERLERECRELKRKLTDITNDECGVPMGAPRAFKEG